MNRKVTYYKDNVGDLWKVYGEHEAYFMQTSMNQRIWIKYIFTWPERINNCYQYVELTEDELFVEML